MNAKTNAKTIVHASLATVGCLALSACGGGGGGGVKVASTPTPSPTPTPTPPAATPTANFLAKPLQSQEFTVYGGTATTAGAAPSTATADLPRVRYDSAADRYDVMVPGGQWAQVVDSPSSSGDGLNTAWVIGNVASMTNYTAPNHSAAERVYDFSSLSFVYEGLRTTGIAFGVPTPAANVPTLGSASFAGLLLGASDEIVDYWDWGLYNAQIGGTINLAFDFSAGTLSGAVNPTVYGYDIHSLPEMAFTNTVYSTGSATFSGTFATALPGANSFAGQFTGPAAQELIGSFAFPYVSPENGQTYSAAGGFVAKK